MKINKMGSDYFAVTDDQGRTLAMVDLHIDRNNPFISFVNSISLWDARGVMWQVEEYLKNPW